MYPFKIIVRNEAISVGEKIFAPNGREGIVISIESVKLISMNEIEVVGRAKLKN
ncbi:hypothetical protein P4H06_34030 [Bacillus cereus]|uniref:hypothetical protein n=1 Tax=Bacillus cereus group TaxID=86661 RepID=UPI001298CB63|nr:hypothetical protein [Bacillus thuringiensis]MDA2112769.1 hypothetical protein [Bacillus cereus]MDA2130602.1 hypothetical protein [Bacillus cereus]MDA2152423.1 hypothetical protein [Bacillus cereus]MEB8861251.1 hypothetical protein [Bacillus cereus]MEC2468572.1 hypothetical protein [Bacillus cereus]